MIKRKLYNPIGLGRFARVACLVALLAIVSGCEDNCLLSIESPSTEGNCEPVPSGQVCVQEIDNEFNSTFTQGVDFLSAALNIDLTWCPNADCSPDLDVGRAIVLVVHQHSGNDITFVANCQNRRIQETVDDVQQIIIKQAQNLSEENTACGGNTVQGAFAKWEICEVPIVRGD